MLRIAICEDDRIQMESLVKTIHIFTSNFKLKYKIFEFTKGETLLLSNEFFDIYFLDIKLDTISGIDLAKKVRSTYENAIIIFITGFADYVFDAFDVGAFHYLLKPIDEKKFIEVLTSAINKLSKKDNFIIAKTMGFSTKIMLSELMYIESNQRKIKLHTTYDVIEYYYKISDLENELLEYNFFRCHKSYIVNLKYIQSFDNTFITLINSEKIYLSKYKSAEFSKTFMYYLKNEA